jgi:hypothetical protein
MAGRRLRAIVASTPARLTLWMAALLVLGLGYGVAALVGSLQTSAQVTSVETSSGPLTVSAQSLYRSLSDADATAAAAFLSAGAEPLELRQRYLDDIASAGADLADVASGGREIAGPLATLASELPVYTGLVESARANNIQGYPVGAAYLREASDLMRGTLLPAAAEVYRAETVRLANDRDGAASYPFIAVGLGVVAVAGLIRLQRYLTRRTNRTANLGLVVATLSILGALVWQNASWVALASHLHSAAAGGSDQVELLAQARIAALQARTDEALTLVARGSGGAFEEDFQKTMQRLTGVDGSGGLLATAGDTARDPAVRASVEQAITDVKAWQAVHTKLRGADDGGQYSIAVSYAIGQGSSNAATEFGKVDADLAAGIQASGVTFRDEAAHAADAIAGVGIAVSVLALLTLGGVAIGVQRRIAEYR